MAWMSRCPKRIKNCWLSIHRLPPWVSPPAGKLNIRSMSEDKFSSLPPSLPMPNTTNSCGLPSPSTGCPHWFALSLCSHFKASPTHASARFESSSTNSWLVPKPHRLRQIKRTWCAFLNRLKHWCNCFSLVTLAIVSDNKTCNCFFERAATRKVWLSKCGLSKKTCAEKGLAIITSISCSCWIDAGKLHKCVEPLLKFISQCVWKCINYVQIFWRNNNRHKHYSQGYIAGPKTDGWW